VHNKVYLITLILVLSLIGLCSAAYITLQADGFPFTTNENITFHGDLNGNNIDVNFWVVDSDGNIDYNIYLGDRNGSFSVTYAPSSEGDYNAYARDLNNGIQAVLPFKVSDIASVTLNYNTTSPPFDASDVNRVYVTFTAYDVNGNTLSNEDINVDLVRAIDAYVLDENKAKTSADGNVQLSFDLSSLQAGDYYFSVNDGLAVFPFSILSFRVFPSLLDADTNNPQDVFGPAGSVRISVDVMNYAGTSYISGATVNGAVYDSNNTPVQALSFLSSAGNYYAEFTAPSTLGEYYIDFNVTYGNTTQSKKVSFSVQNYAMEVVASRYEGGGMGEKEKMPSVFPTDEIASLELHFIEIGGSELSGTQLTNICNNNGNMQDHNFILYYKRIGATDWNAILTERDINVQTADNYCKLSFHTPTNAGTYLLKIEGRDLNILNNTLNLSSKTMITVQNYLVFLEPVDPATCDVVAGDVAESCGFKFQFTRGEDIGLRPVIIDMKSGTSVNNLAACRGAAIFRKGSETQLSAPADVNFRADLNILEINGDSNVVQSLNGGFYTGGFSVDINSNGSLAQSNVTAFGFFYLKVLNVTAQLVDENGNNIATHGPPTYPNDQNVYIKVTVKDSDGSTAIRGAVVKLSRIVNFFERELIYERTRDSNRIVSTVDSNSTNSSGVATLTLDYNELNLGSGEFEVEIDIDAATIGKTDTTTLHFERRNFYLEAEPVSKSQCSPLPMVSGDMNVTFLLHAMDPWGWQPINDLNVVDVKVFYEGRPDKPLSLPAEKQVSFTTTSITCEGIDYNAVDVNHNGTWEPGFYKFKITVESALKGRETTTGFIRVQPFFIVAVPAREGELGQYAAPGSQWDFNIMSSQDVNITAKLMNVKNWSVSASDLNMHHHETGAWIAGSGSDNGYEYNDVNGTDDPSQYTTIDVNIPSNLSIATDPEMDGYILDINAVNTSGQEAHLELFIIPRKWQVFVAKAPIGEYTRGEPGPFFFWITGDEYRKMLVDNNVLDNCEALRGIRYPADANFDDAGLNYTRIVMVKGGLDDVNGTETDWNSIILVNPATEQIWVDRDNDCNFNEEPDINALTVGDYVSGIRSNMMYMGEPQEEQGEGEQGEQGEEGESQGPLYFQHPYNGLPIITGITNTKLLYTTDTLIEALTLSNEEMLQNDPFIGTYDTDHNFAIPVVVKDLNNQPVSGVEVSIQQVMRAEIGGGMPTPLSSDDYNAYNAITDENGLAVPKIAVDNAGIIMVGLKVSDGSTTQTIMPWEGAAFQAKPFIVVFSYGLEDLNIQFDKNALVLDVNTDAIPLDCFNPATTTIGVLNEKDFNIRGISMRVNFDNDVDINLDVNDGPNEFAMFDGNPAAIGSANAVNETHTDLNEITVASADAFLVCLYGPGKCSSDGEGYNPGALYDMNELADDSITDGDLIIYNLFDYSDQFYNPSTYGSDSRIREFLRLEVRGQDYNYVDGPVTVSNGAVFDESTGNIVVSNISGSLPSGAGYRILMDGNFEPSGLHGSSFAISIDVNYANDVVPAFGFMWSRKP